MFFSLTQLHRQIGRAILLPCALFLVASCGSSTSEDPDTTAVTAPKVVSTTPADAATNIARNATLSVLFDRAMEPIDTATFTLLQGTNEVSGAVSTADDGKSAVFTPASNLNASSVFVATLTTDAKSAAGIAMEADHTWSFTTGTSFDGTAPTIVSTAPVANATGVVINTKVAVLFSEAMDPLTVTPINFTLKNGATAVPGNVAYGPGYTAVFTPTSLLAGDTVFTATLSTEVSDLQGIPIASELKWSFTTGTLTSSGPAPVLLGTSVNYAILAKSAISTVPNSAITGDIAISPAAASFMTGFSLVADGTNVFSTSTQIVGKAYASNYAVPTPAVLTTAVGDMETAYTDAAGRITPDYLELGTGNIGGKTLAPGLYKWTSTITIPENVTIFGGANDVWIFQTSGDLTMSSAKNVTLTGGALAKNVFWQVAGQVVIGANAHFEGVLLCRTDVTLQTGATMNGRILAQTQVALDQATITEPAL